MLGVIGLRINTVLGPYNQDSMKVNPVLENQIENSEKQQEDEKDSGASSPAVRTD